MSKEQKRKLRIALVKQDKTGLLICPGCGSIHLTGTGMTDDGPVFACEDCPITPVLHVVTDKTVTRVFWGY